MAFELEDYNLDEEQREFRDMCLHILSLDARPPSPNQAFELNVP